MSLEWRRLRKVSLDIAAHYAISLEDAQRMVEKATASFRRLNARLEREPWP